MKIGEKMEMVILFLIVSAIVTLGTVDYFEQLLSNNYQVFGGEKIETLDQISDKEDLKIIIIIVSGIGLLLGIICPYLWAKEQSRVIKKNRLSLMVQREGLDALMGMIPGARVTLDSLVANNPEVIWTQLRESFYQIDLPQLESEFVQLGDICNGGRFSANKAKEQLRLFAQKIAKRRYVIVKIGAMAYNVARAKDESANLIKVLMEKIDTEIGVRQDTDVTERSKMKLRAVVEKFNQAVELSNDFHAERINWINIQARLEVVSKEMQKALKEVYFDKAMADRARSDGPELLRNFPAILDQFEKEVGTSFSRRRNLEEAWTKYDYAKALSSHDERVDWTTIFLTLTMASSLCGISNAFEGDEKSWKVYLSRYDQFSGSGGYVCLV